MTAPRRSLRLLEALVAIAVIVSARDHRVSTQERQPAGSATYRGVGTAVRFDVSPPLSELALREPIEFNEPEVERFDDPPSGLEGPLGPQDVDQLVQRQVGRSPSDVSSPLVSFDAMSQASGPVPPDTNGDVGPNHYVQMVNSRYAVFSKNGSILAGPANINTLWSGFGGPCQTENAGDPVVLYDQLADRWLLTQFTSAGPTFFNCVALSTSGNPAGTYFRWAFTSGTNFPDYPKYGIWSDAYYISTREFSSSGPFAGIGAYALNRVQMIAGNPSPQVISFLATPGATPFRTGDGLLPADIDGSTLPTAGTPEFFIGTQDNGGPYGATSDAINIWKFTADFVTPANSTFVFSNAVPTAAFDSMLDACGGGRNCVPQPGTAQKVDHQGYRQRPLHRAAYRNFGTHESIVTNQSVEVAPAMSGIRWWELRSPNATPVVFQEGTYAPGVTDGIHRWFGSVAQDRLGNIALGYSVSNGTNTSPGIRYTGRLTSDPAGTMPQSEEIGVNGSGSQTSTAARWGDYSSMNVDPTDDCTMWYTTEYYAATSDSGWRTRVVSFKFPNCFVASGTVQGFVRDGISNLGINGATVNVGGLSTTTDSNGFYTLVVAPASYSATASAAGYSPSTVTGVVVSAGATTNQSFSLGPPGTITGHVNDASTAAPIGNASIVINPGNLTTTTDVNGLYSKSVTAGTYSVTASAANHEPSTATGVVVGFGGTVTRDFQLAATQTAVFDASFKAPKCSQVGATCDSGPTLVLGRDNMSGGPEPNQPNTINNSCADGTGGDFHSDESLDRIKVSTVDGTAFAPGKTVRIDATAWVFSSASNRLDLYFAANASTPNWTFISTLTPPGTGAQNFSTTYTLPTGGFQAVRGVFRFGGSASPCGTQSGFDDRDDLVFAVTPPTVTAPATVTPGATITGTVANGPAQARDWVGLYCPTSQADTAFAAFKYLANNSTTPPTSGVAGGSVTFTAPTTNGQTCNLRFFQNDTYTKLATSGNIAVQTGPTLTINDVSVTEGNSGTVNATFTVSLSPVNASQTVTVDFATANNTATAGSDYTAQNGTLTFNPNDSSKPITIVVSGDTASESNETFFVNLTNAANASIGDAQGVGTITNDDAPPSPAVTAAPTVTPGGTITGTVSNGPANALDWVGLYCPTSLADNAYTTFKYLANNSTTPPGGGVSGGTVTFTAPSTNGTQCNLRFFSNDSYNKLATSGTVTVQSGPTLTINDVSVTEGNSGTVNASFTVTLSPVNASQTVTVDFATANNSATAGSDYVALNGTLTFNPNDSTKPITIVVNGDTASENNETFFINLTNASNAQIGDAQGVGTITNDDTPPGPSVTAPSTVAPGGTVTATVSNGPANALDWVGFYCPVSQPDNAYNAFKYLASNSTTPPGAGVSGGTVTFTAPNTNGTQCNLRFFSNDSYNKLATSGTVTVQSGPALTINDVSVTEGNSGTVNATFTVTLSPVNASQTVTVDFATANNSASAGSDYVAQNGTLTFNPNDSTKPITIVVNGDTASESNETFFINLTNAANAQIGDAQGIGTITNDDTPPGPSITAPATVAPGATITGTVSNGPSNALDWVGLYCPTSLPDTGYNAFKYLASNSTAPPGAGVSGGTVTFTAPSTNGTQCNLRFFSNDSYTKLATSGTVTVQSGPALTINDVSVTEGNSGTVNATFTVTLSPVNASQTVTVDFATANNSASAGSDYVAQNGTLTFNPNDSTKPVTIVVNGDTASENNETFFVNLTNASNAQIGDAQGVGTITNDDTPPGPAVTAPSTVTPGATVTGTVSNGPSNALDWVGFYCPPSQPDTAYNTFKYLASNSTTPPGTGVSGGTVTFTAPNTNGATCNLRFFSNDSYNKLATSGTVTVQSGPALTINDVSVTEGNSGTVNATFTVTLSPVNASQTVTVNFATANNTASAGSDYVAQNNTLTFAPNDTTKPITVVVNGDTSVESNETFFVNLTDASNASIADAQGIGTITNDDSPPPPSVTAPATVAPGAAISGTVANGPANALDWVGFYCPPSLPDTGYNAFRYLTNNSTAPPASGVSGGTVTFTAPNTAGATCNLRFFANDGYTKLATSGTVTTTNATGLSVGGNVNVSKLSGNQSEAAVAISRTDANRIVVVSNIDAGNGLYRAFSTNGGSSWTGSIIANGDALGTACCDGSLAADSFGNIFLTYLNSSATAVQLAVSIDGGNVFTPVATIASGSVDQPSVAVGANTVWVTWRQTSGIAARGASVSALGVVGAFSTAQVAPGTSGDGNFGDIVVGPTGQVIVTYQTPSGGQGPATVFVNRDLDGIGGSGFGSQITVASTNVGGFDFIPAQSARSVDSESGLAYDRSGGAFSGRLYMLYTEETPNESNDLDVLVLRSSSDNGATWSAATKVNNDATTRSQFLPRIAVDQTNGNIVVCWHDSRNSAGNSTAQFFCALSTDGGVSFKSNALVSGGTSNASLASNGIDYGDYTGLDFHNGVIFPAWADNSNSTGDNPVPSKFDIYTSKITLGGGAAPTTAAPEPIERRQ